MSYKGIIRLLREFCIVTNDFPTEVVVLLQRSTNFFRYQVYPLQLLGQSMADLQLFLRGENDINR